METVKDILQFFDTYIPGLEPVRLSTCEVVMNQSLFIASSLLRIKSSRPGSTIYETELSRLRTFYTVVTDKINSPVVTDKGITPKLLTTESVTAKSASENVTDNLNVCLSCGEPFKPKRSDSLYCSPACKQKDYRLRIRKRNNPKIESYEIRTK